MGDFYSHRKLLEPDDSGCVACSISTQLLNFDCHCLKMDLHIESLKWQTNTSRSSMICGNGYHWCTSFIALGLSNPQMGVCVYSVSVFFFFFSGAWDPGQVGSALLVLFSSTVNICLYFICLYVVSMPSSILFVCHDKYRDTSQECIYHGLTVALRSSDWNWR